MAGDIAKEIFEKYNNKMDVVRCPNGRAVVRKALDYYAKAAVNLYGVISRNELVEIFNGQNSYKTTDEELYILLLPLVLKDKWYGFYKEYIVHYWFFDDFEEADYLLENQKGKPRYIPDKDEFLNYVVEGYADNDHWWNVQRFMGAAFGFSKNIMEGFQEVKSYITYGNGISELNSIFERHHIAFSSEGQIKEFICLIMQAKNNTRIWENNGYTPSELHEIRTERDKNVIDFPVVQKLKVGRNDPCPCGSGKKYKKCCGIIDEKKSSQLSADECREFYETWYGLLGFVNERKKVINAVIRPEYPNVVSDMKIHKVREVLWDNPELIEEYIKKTALPQDKIEILKQWSTKFRKGMFFVLEYQPEYAVIIDSDEHGKDRLYGIKGISNSVSGALQRKLPVQIETVLLPFKGKIIYDGFMASMQIEYAEGAKAAFSEMYANAKRQGIITRME
ncbi:YecA family protein [Youngiibacter fragilis]|uniref:Zinc chelation protein SecC n=1 Tax=Youngiibacter fragilis 232.1 TaxID=994573 RepID=V7I4E3_9CLOT|nr:SEC-C metal-binding domain-containing protein [Youngiibacter fragilis]ETA80156.1 zinc chelation protein SecC [Youngiibacter fragilis 232.1]